jgi:hypothetical protein
VSASPEILAQLDELERQSNERRAALQRLAADIPAALSRRAVVRSMLSDARRAPHKLAIVQRGFAKLGRAPRRLLRTLRTRP